MRRSSTAEACEPGRGGCATGRQATARQGQTLQCRPAALLRLGPQGQAAFTMIELLVVIAIMAVMAGITAASFVGVTRRASREGARENIIDVLRQAHVSAVDTGRGAVVRIDPVTNSVYGIATTVIGAWHFEQVDATNHTPGARGYNGTVHGTTPLVPGKLGLALNFDGTDSYVDCGTAPIWNQTTGIRLEAWVNPGPGVAGASGPIMSKEAAPPNFKGYFIGADYNGDGTVNFEGGFAVPAATLGFAPGTVYLKSTQTYSCGQWHSVAAEFDGFEARLYVDGALAASNFDDGTDGFNGTVGNAGAFSNWKNAAPALMGPAAGQPLYIGQGLNAAFATAFFTGIIDEPRVLSIASGSPVTLPQLVPMVTGSAAIYYDTQGFLNLNYHTGPVYLAVGDPYQAANLAGGINASAPALALKPTNPFPPTGGLLLIVSTAAGQSNELLSYDNTGALTRNWNGVTGASAHNAGDKVYFARAIEVDTTGLVVKP